MFSQMMAAVGQAQERIQTCDLSYRLRGLIFYGSCYTWKACKESWRGTGNWGWRNHWLLCLCFLVLPALCVKPLWRALTVCGHPALVLLYWHLRRARWWQHRADLYWHNSLCLCAEYLLLLWTLEQAQRLSVHWRSKVFIVQAPCPIWGDIHHPG